MKQRVYNGKMKKVDKVCSFCGKPYFGFVSSKFCSRRCSASNQKRRKKIICKNCGKEFEVCLGNKTTKFCSKKCYTKYMTGRNLPKEQIKKIRKAHKKIGAPWMKGKHNSPATEFKKGIQNNPNSIFKKGNTGKKCINYKHGLSKTLGYKSFIENIRKVRKLKNGGSHTLGEWETLKAQYNWTCPSCGLQEPFNNQRTKSLTEDHIIPLSKGGSNNIENIQPLCRSCNCKKSTKIIKYETIS